MQQPNPYAPPTAPVEDPEIPVEASTPHVELACRLFWISLGLSVVESLRSLFDQSTAAGMIGVLIGTAIVIGVGYLIVRWIVGKLRAGRNWMRWLITSLNLLGFLAIAVFWDFYRNAFQVILQGSWLSVLILALQSVAGIAILVLLHTPTTREWFAAKATQR